MRTKLIQASALALLAVALLWTGWPQPTFNGSSDWTGSAGRGGVRQSKLADHAPAATSQPTNRAAPQRIVNPAPKPTASADSITGFKNWTLNYLRDPRPERIAEGLRLAQQRRPVFKQLIVDAPRQAIEQAVPMVHRQQLPAEILEQLEKRINDIGALRVFQGVPLNPEDSPVATTREVELKSGGTYRAHVYGQRAQKITWTHGAFVNGVAMDSEFAISEDPTRRLEVGELLPKGKPVVSSCPVSGKSVLKAEEIPAAIPESLPAVETPLEIITFCDGSHIATQNQTILYGEGVTGGSMAFSGILPGSPTPALGQVKVIVIPTTYADQNAIPSTEADLYATLRDVADHYSKASYGRLSLSGVVTPAVKLPHNEAWYVNRDSANGGDIGGTGISMADARAEALKMGYDWNDYDCTVMRHNGGPGSYGGLAGGSTVWVRGNSVGLWAHEIGHCFGLGHSNFWDTAGSSSIGNGANNEYGDTYDVMGSASVPPGHYNAQAKNQIRWLPTAFTQAVTQSGLYRVHAFDQAALEPGRSYALTIQKDAQRTYWGMLRSLYDGNPFAKNGLVLGWRFPNGGGGNFQLIDSTNGSPFGKTDAPISLGATFSDSENGIHLTTVAVAESPRSIDMQVNLGDFPDNRAPSLSLSASAISIPLNATVSFTASAEDPDGDALAYQWQHFGSSSTQIVSPNAPLITRQFPASGTFVVTCTVSDMKGGRCTRNQLITVGSPSSFTISGRVTLAGRGLQEVVINANNANGVITDSDGHFIIPNLSANTYTLSALRYGYSFSELFNNSITVGPSFSGASFDALEQSVVSLGVIGAQADELAPVTAARVRLARSGDLSQDLVVNLNAPQGSAIRSTDYTLSPDPVAAAQGFSSLTIPAESAFVDILVTPVTDSLSEGPESVTLQLGPGNGYRVGAASSASVWIADDDSTLPKISVRALRAMIAENASAAACFALERSGDTQSTLSINLSFAGNARISADYLAGSALTFGSGQSLATLEVMPVDDGISETLETLSVSIIAAPSHLVDPLLSSASISLRDDDLQVVQVSASDPNASEVDLSQVGAQADTGTFLVTRSGDLSSDLNVYYAFSGTNGTGVMALHGTDFDWMPGVVVIPANQTSASITISPRFDRLGEGSEQCVLNLGANATNYRVEGNTSATININDSAADLPYVDVINTALGSEPATNANFRFTIRRQDNNLPLRLNYSLGGTATNGADYEVLGWWLPQSSPSSQTLRSLWAADALNLWAVGDNGTILRSSDGSTWSAQNSGSTQHLRCIWGSSATSLWAVGDNGTILRSSDGSTWSALSTGSTQHLRGIWGSSATNLWVVGDNGTILRSSNGSSWSSISSGSTKTLNAVHGSDASNLWAVGADGVILKYNGTAWAAQTSGISTALNAVFALNSTNIWAVGAGGVIRKGSGSTWSAQTSGTPLDLTGVWAGSSSNLMICGAAGTQLLSSNGTSWTQANLSQGANFNAVLGSSSSLTFSVATQGGIFKRDSVNATPLPDSVLVPRAAGFFDLAPRTRDDFDNEDLESLSLTLTADPTYQLFAPSSSATASLRDNDNANTILIDTQVGTGGSVTTVEGGTGVIKFYLSRLGSTTQALGVNLSYAGSATGGGVDYSAPASVTIPAGANGVDVNVSIVNDTIFEGTESIILSLAPGTYSRGPEATMLINDNETSTATVSFSAISSSAQESAGSIGIPVTLSAAQARDVSVAYQCTTANSSSSANQPGLPIPYWVRLVKTGDQIGFFQSNDGINWSQRGSNSSLTALGGNSYLAGVVFAPGSGSSFSASIDQISVSGLSEGGSISNPSSQLIGTATGSTSSSSSTACVLTNSGNGLSNSGSDSFQFFSFVVSNSANCTLSARVTSIGNSASTGSRAGVMLRSSVAANAPHASSLATGVSTGGFHTLLRSSTGATATLSSAYSTAILPMWLSCVRNAGQLTQRLSRDGVNWSNFSTSHNLDWGPKSLVGLAVSAASDGQIATANFDQVSLNASPLTSLGGRSIGFVNEQGSESCSEGLWTVSGSGAGIGGSNDEAHFPSIEVSGDFTLTARVVSLSGGASAAQAGIMVRDGIRGYNRSIYTGWQKSGLLEQRYRLQSIGNAQGAGVDFLMPNGLLVFPAGSTTANIPIALINDDRIEPNELITLGLFNPNGAVLGTNTQHGLSIIDDDLPPANPRVGFAAASASVAENAGFARIAVSLSTPATQRCSVDVASSDGSATAPQDYLTLLGTIRFDPGQSTAWVNLPIVDDAANEGTQTINLTLSNPSGLELSSLSGHQLSLIDDDFPSVDLTTTDASASEAGDPATFLLRRGGDLSQSLSVTLLRQGSATHGSDYGNLATTQVFAIGQASIELLISPLQDALNEGNETIVLSLVASASHTIGAASSATINLSDDDRCTLSLDASDPLASESAGNKGSFTLTRSEPLTTPLTVNLTLVGTASSGADYNAISGSVSFASGEASKTLEIVPLDDNLPEGDEDVTLSLASGAYDLGPRFFGTVRITDNDIAPSVFINQPAAQGPLLAPQNGLIVGAAIADDGGPQPLSIDWSCIAGPAAVFFESGQAASTAVTFGAAGTYVLRISVSDGQFTASDQVTVVVGTAAEAMPWISMDLGPVSQRRGQSLGLAGVYSISGTGIGYGSASDQAHVMLRASQGDGNVTARLVSAPAGPALAGITVRDSLFRGSTRAVLGHVSGVGLQWRTRTAAATVDSVITVATPPALPLWLRIDRNATSGELTASYAPDVSGNPGPWTSIGSPVVPVMLNSDAHYGLTCTSNSSSSTATAVFDQLSLTPQDGQPALVNEDSGTAPVMAGSGSVNAGVYSVAGSSNGYFYGWQYAGDLEITARLTSYSSGAGSSSAGLRIAESLEGGAYLHLGRMPTGSYNGYYWTNLAGGSSGGVPSGIANGNWIRIVRRGNSVTGFRAAHNAVTGLPGAWIQIGQAQTVIMPATAWVGFYVNNASGVGLNSCTFSNLSIRSLHRAPQISATASTPLAGQVSLTGSLIDDALPMAAALQWQRVSGPAGLLFSQPGSLQTNGSFTRFGSYRVRLTADDSVARSFADASFAVAATGFAKWLEDNAVGIAVDDLAESVKDADEDGILNLLEYGIGSNGTIANSLPQYVSLAADSGWEYLRLSLPRNPSAENLRWIVEISDDLQTWTSEGLITEIDVPALLVVRDAQPRVNSPRRFMRVRVELTTPAANPPQP